MTWEKEPLLMSGLYLLLGTAAALSFQWVYLAPLAILIRPTKYGFCGLLLFLAAFSYATYSNPSLPSTPVYGTALFHPTTVQKSSSPFHKSLIWKGTIRHFEGEGIIIENLPCTLHSPLGRASSDFLIEGTLIPKKQGSPIFKPDRTQEQLIVPHDFNISALRYDCKKKVQSFFHRHINDSSSADLIGALITGELSDRKISLEFSRLGLQHILAISGFHFALIAIFCSFLFRALLSPLLADTGALIAITFYYLFIGPSPSVTRAWIGITLLLLTRLFNLRCSPLNALGAALTAELILDPTSIFHIGFQLTFLCTLAILLFYRPCERFLYLLLPKRTLDVALQLSFVEKHIYIIGSLLRPLLALNLAVSLVSIPTLLFLFHNFPLLSLAYNLFIPICITTSLLLTGLALFLPFFFPLISAFTAFYLSFISNPPAFLDLHLRLPPFSSTYLILYLTLLLSLSRKRVEQKM